MRVRRVTFSGTAGPVRSCDVPLGDFTAVLGLNDAGKSRFVGEIVAVLDGRSDEGCEARVVAELDDRDIADLLGIDNLLLTEASWPEARVRGLIAHGHFGGPDTTDPTGLATWLMSSNTSDELRVAITKALANSRLFEFEFDAEGDMWGNKWNVNWCVPRSAAMPADVEAATVAAVERQGLPWRPRLQPQPVTHVRKIGQAFMPRAITLPITLPISPAALAAEATVAIGRLARFLRVFDDNRNRIDRLLGIFEDGITAHPEYSVDDIEEWLAEYVLEPEAPASELFSLRRDQITISADVAQICDFVSRTASELAAPFIQDRYRFELSVSPVLVGESASPVAIELSARQSETERDSEDDAESSDPPSRFPLDVLADGHAVWVQLAVLHALEWVTRATRALQLKMAYVDFVDGGVSTTSSFEWALNWPGRIEAEERFPSNTLDPEPQPATSEEGVGRLKDSSLSESAGAGPVRPLRRVDYLRAQWEVGRIRDVKAAVDGLRRSDWSPLLAMASALGPKRLFVLDEPERHLHPRAQRELAAWLHNFATVDGAQTIVTTHSPAFLAEADALLYVERQATGVATVRPVDPEAFSALDGAAMELGLDRGELLAGVGAFLFVEGPSDRLVLEGLYGPRLRREGVAVFVLHGIKQAQGVLDAQILMRFTSAKVAVLVDGLAHEVVERAQRDPAYRAKLRRSPKIEESAIAKLLDAADVHGREVVVFSIPDKKDIFFTLDEQAIRSVFPKYPGHQLFDAAYKRDQKNGEHYKAFRERKFDIPKATIDWYPRIVEQMRAGQRYSPDLDAAIANILEQLGGVGMRSPLVTFEVPPDIEADEGS